MAHNRKYITVNGKKWAYIELGEPHLDKPPLFILHGVLSYADYFLPIALGLAQDFHIILPDIPGFGYSESPSKNHFAHIAKELSAFIKALGFNKADIYGQSMGASIILALGSIEPAVINKAYINSPYWRKGGVNYRLLERFELLLAKMPSPLIKKLANPFNLKLVLKFAELLRPDMKPLLNYNKDMILECLQLSDLNAMSEIYFSVENYDLASQLNTNFPDSILIWGEHDKTIPYKEMFDLKQSIGKPIAVVEDEDHEIILDSPLKVVHVIKECSLHGKCQLGQGYYWI